MGVLITNQAGPGAVSFVVQDSKNRDLQCRLEPGQSQSFEVRGAIRISREVAGFEDEPRAKTAREMSSKERKGFLGEGAPRDASEEDADKRGGSKNPGTTRREVDQSANDAPGANTTGEDTENSTLRGASVAKAAQNQTGRETTRNEKDPATDRSGNVKARQS